MLGEITSTQEDTFNQGIQQRRMLGVQVTSKQNWLTQKSNKGQKDSLCGTDVAF